MGNTGNTRLYSRHEDRDLSPDEIFEQAAGQAAELGISRSEFFARAARRYLDELAAQSLTRIDRRCSQAGDETRALRQPRPPGTAGAGDDDW